MRGKIEELLIKAKKVRMSAEQEEAQRRSFAFGNAAFENPRITREMVDKAADAIGRPKASKLEGDR